MCFPGMLGCGAAIYFMSRRSSPDERTPLLRLFDRTARPPERMELQPLPRPVGSESTTQSQQTSSPRSSPGASTSATHQWKTLTPPRVASPTSLEVTHEESTQLYFYLHRVFAEHYLQPEHSTQAVYNAANGSSKGSTLV